MFFWPHNHSTFALIDEGKVDGVVYNEIVIHEQLQPSQTVRETSLESEPQKFAVKAPS